MHRKYLFLSIGVILYLSSALAQTSVQTVAATTRSASTNTLSFSSNTTAGNLILVGVNFYSNATFSSISDSQGNTFTQIGNELITVGGVRSRVYYAKNIKGGPDMLTVTISTSSSALQLYLTEYSGVNQTTPIDTQTGSTGNAGAVSSGYGTTTVAGDLIYGYCVGDAQCTAGSGFRILSTHSDNLVEEMTAAGPGPYAATGSSNSGWTMQMVALKAASSASPPPTGGGSSSTGACDLSQPYGTPDSSDVQAAINMTLGVSPCTANIIGTGLCNVVMVQRVVNAALPGGTCVTGSGSGGGGPVSHSVVLNWSASPASGVAYKVYRSTSAGVYSTPLASSISATSYTDGTVQSGTTYYYVVTAVNSGGESARSNESPAAIPVP